MTALSFRTKRQPAKASEQTAELPRVFAAPGMLDGGTITVNREQGDSDVQYQSRCELVDMLIERAKEG